MTGKAQYVPNTDLLALTTQHENGLHPSYLRICVYWLSANNAPTTDLQAAYGCCGLFTLALL